MRLSTKGRYAVTALADVALNEMENAVPLSDISARQEISLTYLEQIFLKLRRAGLVQGQRGPGGGYKLSHSAGDITIAQIMSAVDESFNAMKCEGDIGKGCGGSQIRCLTHDLWERMSAHMHVFLQGTTLADVIGQKVAPCPAVADFHAERKKSTRHQTRRTKAQKPRTPAHCES